MLKPIDYYINYVSGFWWLPFPHFLIFNFRKKFLSFSDATEMSYWDVFVFLVTKNLQTLVSVLLTWDQGSRGRG